jgi:hypothetical protein
MRTRRKLALFTNVFRQELEKLFLILSDQLRQLRVSGSDLLQDWLQHLRLLLDKLT